MVLRDRDLSWVHGSWTSESKSMASGSESVTFVRKGAGRKSKAKSVVLVLVVVVMVVVVVVVVVVGGESLDCHSRSRNVSLVRRLGWKLS